jgi:hypothetical protein
LYCLSLIPEIELPFIEELLVFLDGNLGEIIISGKDLWN